MLTCGPHLQPWHFILDLFQVIASLRSLWHVLQQRQTQNMQRTRLQDMKHDQTQTTRRHEATTRDREHAQPSKTSSAARTHTSSLMGNESSAESSRALNSDLRDKRLLHPARPGLSLSKSPPQGRSSNSPFRGWATLFVELFQASLVPEANQCCSFFP